MSAKLHTLGLGTRFRIVGLEEDGVLELMRVSHSSAYVRSTARRTRQFEVRGGTISVLFDTPSDGYNISPNTIVVEVP